MLWSTLRTALQRCPAFGELNDFVIGYVWQVPFATGAVDVAIAMQLHQRQPLSGSMQTAEPRRPRMLRLEIDAERSPQSTRRILQHAGQFREGPWSDGA